METNAPTIDAAPEADTILGTYTTAGHDGASTLIDVPVFAEGECEGEIDVPGFARILGLDAVMLVGFTGADWTFRVLNRDGDRIGTLEVHAGAGA